MNPYLIRLAYTKLCKLSRKTRVIFIEMPNPSLTFVETVILYKKMNTETNITICSFNINGTKDKDVALDQKLDYFDISFPQEHLLPLMILNSLHRSNKHLVVSKIGHRTSGRPSGGLACLIKNTLFSPPPLRYHESNCFIGIRLTNLALINV